jgi:hypothetical protein
VRRLSIAIRSVVEEMAEVAFAAPYGTMKGLVSHRSELTPFGSPGGHLIRATPRRRGWNAESMWHQCIFHRLFDQENAMISDAASGGKIPYGRH